MTRKLAAAVVAALTLLTLTAGPADAGKDSGWGCGGGCRSTR